MPAQETLQALQFLAGLEQQQVGFGAYGDGPATRRLREFVVGKNHPRSLGSRYDDAVSMEARNADLMAADQRQREMRLQAGLQGQYAEQQFRHRMAEQQQGIEDQQALERTRWQQPGGAGGQNSKEREMRLLAELNEEAAKNKFDREAEMAGIRSRYDLQGHKEKFGFDRTLSDMETDRQFGYLDRQNKLAVDLNEQKFTQQQKQALQEINLRKDEQFNMALNEARGRADNLNPHGQRLLKEIEDGVSEIEATAPKNGEEWARQAKQQLLGKIGQAMQPQLLQSKIQTIDPEGKVKGWYDQKKEWRELPPPNANAVEPVPPEIAQRGGILRGPDGQPMQYISPQKPMSAAEIDPTIRRDEWITERLKQKTNDPLNPGGRYVTPQEAVAEWNQIQQSFAAPNPRQQQALQQIDANSYSERPATEAAMRQGLMQRGPQAQPPRPQNMMPNAGQSFQQAGMQGGNQQQPPVNPQVPVEVQNAARFVQEMKAQYPDPNAMPPEAQRAIEQAVSIVRQFKSGGR